MSVAIQIVTPETLPAFHAGLRHLSDHLGDSHRADADALGAALFGPHPFALGMVAEDGTGALLAMPVFSTIYGGAGLYVSDLWVAEAARGTGMGRRLLSGALNQTLWGAPRFLKLTVYEDNPSARAVYDRLGFQPQEADTVMLLEGAQLGALKDMT
ncbi:N-acetyltransferase [Roseovarius sp. M141]|uniref:GNAT family N-acetyltransferase n=1 Tax=Roseovarius sp. M141 TaxID=2583806 RepID=UPI0020CBCEEC|nr:GNAT family N-acetyltransferase [Roseovarius sp. M141]MCQ0093583.1 GNAT family N-acetyltransferase [Roseovarius sp. M141]